MGAPAETAGPGQNGQGNPSHIVVAPKCGATRAASAASFCTVATEVGAGASMQPIAYDAAVRFENFPPDVRPVYASANVSMRSPMPRPAWASACASTSYPSAPA